MTLDVYDVTDVTDSQIIDIGDSVVEIAFAIFCRCEAAEDFCVQAIGCTIVFGGTNRLILGTDGFRPDPGYCTPKFLERFREHYGPLSS